MHEFVIEICTTLESQDQANELAKYCVESRLAACVQICPINSVYGWKGEVCESKEYLCTMKTTLTASTALKKAIYDKHPYDLPEILIRKTKASTEYANWVFTQTSCDR